MVHYAALSVCGTKRLANEDRVMVDNQLIKSGEIAGSALQPVFALICDGVGGERSGEIASELVASSFINQRVDSPLFDIAKNIAYVNSQIRNEISKDPALGKMATTLAGLYLTEERFYSFNVGDTRIYRIKERIIDRISKEGVNARGRSYRDGILTEYIGGSDIYCRPSFSTGIIGKDMSLLVCSDGIYKCVPESSMVQLIDRWETPEKIIRAIWRIALQNGSEDDLSIIFVRCT